MKICKNCKYFDGKSCNSDKFVYVGQCEDTPEDGLGYWDMESYAAGVSVGPKFGCIHWEGK